jgi:hypothetical protein
MNDNNFHNTYNHPPPRHTHNHQPPIHTNNSVNEFSEYNRPFRFNNTNYNNNNRPNTENNKTNKETNSNNSTLKKHERKLIKKSKKQKPIFFGLNSVYTIESNQSKIMKIIHFETN